MRKILLSILLSCVALIGRAQEDDYKPMLVDGRTWVCAAVVLREHSKEVTDCDTIFKSYTYTKVDMPFLSEEGKQLYLHVDGEKEIQFDFGLNEGDYFRGDRVKCVDTIEVKGKRYRRLSFESIYNYWWVEGIGSNLAPDNPYGWGLSRSGDIYMDKCSVDGKTLFTYSDFAVPGWTENVTGLKSQHSVIPLSITNTYDLQGRRLADKPQKGMYIQDGKKYVK